MDERLEKLYSNILVQWLNLRAMVNYDVDASDKQMFKYASIILEHCLKSAGFNTDLDDFVKELEDIA